MEKKRYIKIQELEVYQLSRKLSRISWEIYQTLTWEIKKITGNQFIEATDSIGANITEGYLRFHYLDKIKFYYNARSSLAEADDHWIELLKERGFVKDINYQQFKKIAKQLSVKLNNFINSTYRTKINEKTT